MHVAVLIVGYRNPDDIVRCLAALSASTHADFSVFVCENGGPEAFARLQAELPATLPGGQAVTLHEAAGNLGFAGGVNEGLKHNPAADAWWVLNPDTQPDPGALAAMVARLARGDCDAVGCTLYRPDGSVQSHGGRWRAWLARAESLGNGERVDSPIDAAQIEQAQSYLNGASMLMGRRFLETVGPMREDYFLYAEESEWCLRALKRGMRLGFAAEARVMHAHGTTTGANEPMRSRRRLPIYLDTRNRILLTRDLFPARLPVAAAAALAQVLVRYGRHGAWAQLGFGVSGWIAGLRGERGPPAWAR
ncbi:MAG: glycosyltransferase family 2 protein [Caulobacterales bacterium]|nr:glycosyltransferase family 2 protein [Caulobacterales bacterium]